MFRFSVASAVFVILVSGTHVRAQDADEVKRLKERIELLEARLKLAEKENARLRMEIEEFKAGELEDREGAKIRLSDLLPEGKVIAGDFRSIVRDEGGKVTISISERDGRKVKATGVTQIKDKDPIDHLFEGEVKGSQLTLRSVGGPSKINITVILKGEGLEGTWSTSNLNKGTVGFKLTN